MNNSDVERFEPESTESISISDDTLNLNKLNISNRNTQTGAAQGFYSRFVILLNSLYKNQNLLNKEQMFLLYGAFLGGYLTMSNLSPDYRFDKSPTTSSEYDNDSWQNLDNEYFISYADIEDQPNYSHNDVFILAQKIGFPTEFEL